MELKLVEGELIWTLSPLIEASQYGIVKASQLPRQQQQRRRQWRSAYLIRKAVGEIAVCMRPRQKPKLLFCGSGASTRKYFYEGGLRLIDLDVFPFTLLIQPWRIYDSLSPWMKANAYLPLQGTV